MTKFQAVNLIHQFGCMELIRNTSKVEAVAERMVSHQECVAHAAFVVMAWPVCYCSPCRRNRLK